mgnify:CR=1 FL=1
MIIWVLKNDKDSKEVLSLSNINDHPKPNTKGRIVRFWRKISKKLPYPKGWSSKWHGLRGHAIAVICIWILRRWCKSSWTFCVSTIPAWSTITVIVFSQKLSISAIYREYHMFPRVTGLLRLSVVWRSKPSRYLALYCVHLRFVRKYWQKIASNSQFETWVK